MKKTLSPYLVTGLLIFTMYILYNRFIAAISDGIAIPLLVLSIILIIVGMTKSKAKV